MTDAEAIAARIIIDVADRLADQPDIRPLKNAPLGAWPTVGMFRRVADLLRPMVADADRLALISSPLPRDGTPLDAGEMHRVTGEPGHPREAD